jgi:hypothetical protein
MAASKANRPDDVISALGSDVEVVHEHHLTCSALLAGMAQLDRAMKVHNISAEELREFCESLERRIVSRELPGKEWQPPRVTTRAAGAHSTRRSRASTRSARVHGIQ